MYFDLKNKSEKERHRALDKALADGIKPLSLFRRINALSVVNQSKPEMEKIFENDKKYIQSTRAYKERNR